MSEEILRTLDELKPRLPPDIQYKVLVDPSRFIQNAIENVFKEVAIAASLSVIVLFLFIGTFRNVVTAAIEIPLSMVLAFTLMRLTGMNLNLISLAGLALSAGMNVDASVVVMENIFRHFEASTGPHGFQSRLKVVAEAVREVWLPILSSTIASLVVFLPLAFTSDLTYALLGDLALAVIFSHGFSAVVALILVPTVRLHLMRLGDISQPRSPIEGLLRRFENAYASALTRFIESKTCQRTTFASLGLLLIALFVFVLPSFPKEIVGKPDTNSILLGVNTQGNSLVRQMDGQVAEVERELLTEFGGYIDYTFTQIWSANSGMIMAMLHEKKKTGEVLKKLEEKFVNTPDLFFWVAPWNPSELPIPNPPHLRIAIRGADAEQRDSYAQHIALLLQEKKFSPV